MRSTLAASFCLALAALTTTAPAQSVTITPDRVLRIHFSIASPPSPAPDVLMLGLGLTTVNAAHTTRTAKLYDCGQLLGTATVSSFGTHVGALALGVANSWRLTGSVWNFDSPGNVANFAPLQNATITGIVDFTIATGSVTFDLANVSLTLLRASTANSGSNSSPQPVITEKVLAPLLTGPAPGTTGAFNSWTTNDGSPGNLVIYGFGFQCAPFPIPCTPPVLFDVIPPAALLIAIVDPAGQTTVGFNVPASAAGATLLTQAVEFTGVDCRVTNFVKHTF